jgi:N-dimethylarginine dimethylaminohydrolase
LETSTNLASKEQPNHVTKHSEKRIPPTLVACRPTWFDVHYKINPWMRPLEWEKKSRSLLEEATIGWQKMHRVFKELGFTVLLVEPQQGLPDIVFTANAAVVLDGRVLLARFRFQERQGEEPHFKAFFDDLLKQGTVKEVASLPKGLSQEGAGDCIWDPVRKLFWAGNGPRSDKEAASAIADFFGCEVVPLSLATQEFYHLDVSMCALSKGHIMYFPGAFSKQAENAIKERVDKDLLLPVDREDANLFALNAVNFGDKIVMSDCSKKLEHKLKEHGYELVRVPVEVFNLAGGSAWCLILRLDHFSNI